MEVIHSYLIRRINDTICYSIKIGLFLEDMPPVAGKEASIAEWRCACVSMLPRNVRYRKGKFINSGSGFRCVHNYVKIHAYIFFTYHSEQIRNYFPCILLCLVEVS